MAVIKKNESPIGDGIKGKLGKPFGYGEREYGSFGYGEVQEFVGKGEHGVRSYGEDEYGDVFDFAGIYQIRHHRTKYLVAGEKETGELYIRKSRFYIPSNPKTEGQQSRRSIFADGVSAWKSLSEDEKNIYRKRAENLRMSGFNLYMREYLLS